MTMVAALTVWVILVVVVMGAVVVVVSVFVVGTVVNTTDELSLIDL